jgi:hypothetical protein
MLELAYARGDLQPPTPPEPPPQDAFAQALERGEREESLNRIGGDADNLARAIAGLPEGEGRSNVRSKYVGDLTQKVQLDALGRKGMPAAPKPGKPQKSTDPNSPESTRLREAVKALYPDTPQATLDAITEDNFESFRKSFVAGQTDSRARDGMEATNERARLDREQRAKIWAEQRNLRWADLDQEERLAIMRLSDKEAERRAKSSAKTEEDTDRAAQDYGKELFKSGLPSAQAKVDELNDMFAKYPKGGLPGVGFFAGAVPSRLEGEDAKRLRMLIGQLGAEYQKSMTGAGASDAERQRYDEVTGLLKRGDDESIRLGVQMMAEDLGVKASALESAYTPAAVNRVKSRGKTDVTHPVRRDPAATAIPKDGNGRPTLEQPAGERRQYSPSLNKTRVLDTSGKVLRIEDGDTRRGRP